MHLDSISNCLQSEQLKRRKQHTMHHMHVIYHLIAPILMMHLM